MIIGVIGDSHDNLPALRKVIERLREHGISVLIHLGDIISPFTVKLMREALGETKVIAVKGNNDGDIYQLTNLFLKYGWIFKQDPGTIELNGKKIFLMHGYSGVDETVNIVRALSKSLDVDVILYGHTHKYVVDRSSGKLILNPGEVCGYLTNKITYALIDLDSLRGEIYFA